MIDLLPEIDEANQMSIELDKKVKFTAFAVSGESRGEFNGKLKTFVSVKNFLTDLEWIWTKQKFLDRKADMAAFYTDIKTDGKIDNAKFKVLLILPSIHASLTLAFNRFFYFDDSWRTMIHFWSHLTARLKLAPPPCSPRSRPT